MGMTIDEAIKKLSQSVVVIGCENWMGARDLALETMRKYQKIQDIIEYHMLKSLPKKNMSGFQKDILEVLEDGKID